MSLNSVNSVIHCKNSIVTTSTTYLGIVTFPVIVIEIIFSLLPLGRYLLLITTQNRYLSRNSSKIFILAISSEIQLLLLQYSYCQMWGTPGDHSNFVLCHNSLSSVKSAKVIYEKLNCPSLCFTDCIFTIFVVRVILMPTLIEPKQYICLELK